ncbi:MAG: TIGR04255 family protein [Gammaproteobacteria bacterium]
MPYPTNFLKQVILRLDYAPVATLRSEKQPALSSQLKERFPVVRGQQLAQIIFSAGVSAGASFEQQKMGWQWLHSDMDDHRVVTLTPEFFALEYKGRDAYKNFAEFRTELVEVYGKFKAAYGVTEYTRIGLRYINEISIPEGEALDWDGLISADLITGIKPLFAEPLRMTRSMHQISGIKDDISCLINYGLNNPDYPNPIARREFVLDLDSYIEGGIAEAEAMRKIDSLYAVCKQMFETSIGAGLRQRMGN